MEGREEEHAWDGVGWGGGQPAREARGGRRDEGARRGEERETGGGGEGKEERERGRERGAGDHSHNSPAVPMDTNVDTLGWK
jgi:hypothetical protein